MYTLVGEPCAAGLSGGAKGGGGCEDGRVEAIGAGGARDCVCVGGCGAPCAGAGAGACADVACVDMRASGACCGRIDGIDCD